MNEKLPEIPELPDTTQAEKWLDPDHFVFEGRIYRVLANGTVIEGQQ